MSHLEDGLFHALLDGEIPSAELPPIQAHLAACAACRARLEEERQLLADAAGLVELLEAPAAGGAAAPSYTRRVRGRSWARGLAWAASVSLAVGLGYAARAAREAPASPGLKSQEVAASDAAPVAPAPLADQPARERAESATARAKSATRSQTTLRTPPPEPAAERKRSNQDVAATAGVAAVTDSVATNSAAPVRQSQPAPRPAAAAEAFGPARRLGSEPMRLEEVVVTSAVGSLRAELVSPEPINLPDAVRRLGGSLRLIEGMVPLRLEAQGPYVRVVYSVAQGELVLQQQLIDGRVVFSVIAPPGFPADSLTKLRARVRE